MAKCVRCGKFSLFKSFPNGLCNNCTAEIEREQKAKELREKQERLKREIAEQERIIAEAEEQLRRQEMLTLPKRFFGFDLAYDYEDVNLFVPDSASFSKMDIGTKLNAYQDPDNPYDNKAVRLEWNSDTLAYFYRGKLQDMANDYLKFGGAVHGVVTALFPQEKKIQTHLGFYKGQAQDEFSACFAKNPRAKKYKLTGSMSQNKQSNIMISHVGEKCDLEYDYDKEKYLVVCGDEIGYLPASAAKLVDKNGEDSCSVFIAEIDTNDSGNYYASVYVFID